MAGWSVAGSFVNSHIGIKPDQSLSGVSFNHRRVINRRYLRHRQNIMPCRPVIIVSSNWRGQLFLLGPASTFP